MNTRRLHTLLAAPLVLAVAALACGGGGGGAQPTATLPPPATNTPAPPPPTQGPGPEGTAPPLISLSAQPYMHSSGAFSISLPEGWEIKERNDGVFADAEGSVASIDISVTNVGLAFDSDSLDSFINAIEMNWFGGFDQYEQVSREPQADGSIGILKRLVLTNGTPQTVVSYYWQAGTVVYEQDFWADTDIYTAYSDTFVTIANSMKTDDAAGAAAPLYNFAYKFTGPGNLYEFTVPYGWTYANSAETNAVVDTWTSPDGLTYIEDVTYDDGSPVSKSDAGAFALSLLKDYYNVPDIKVTDDEVQADGSERLNWYSLGGGFEGTSFFETRGTTFLLLTWIVNSDQYDLFLPVWQSLLASYTVP